MQAIYAARLRGRSGGMAFHSRSHTSETHSSASRRSGRMRQALFPVSGLHGLQCRRIAAEKQVDDLYVLQGALPPSANGVSLHPTTPGGKTPAEPLRQNAAPAVYDGAGRRGVAVFQRAAGGGAFQPSGKLASTQRRVWSMKARVLLDRAFLSLTQMPMFR